MPKLLIGGDSVKIIRKIDVFSLAKFQAVFGLFTGLAIGLIFAGFGALIGSVPAELESSSSIPPSATTIFGIGSIVVLPLLYGIFGFIGGLFTALVSNLVLKVTGGLKIRIDDVSESAEPAKPAEPAV